MKPVDHILCGTLIGAVTLSGLYGIEMAWGSQSPGSVLAAWGLLWSVCLAVRFLGSIMYDVYTDMQVLSRRTSDSSNCNCASGTTSVAIGYPAVAVGHTNVTTGARPANQNADMFGPNVVHSTTTMTTTTPPTHATTTTGVRREENRTTRRQRLQREAANAAAAAAAHSALAARAREAMFAASGARAETIREISQAHQAARQAADPSNRTFAQLMRNMGLPELRPDTVAEGWILQLGDGTYVRRGNEWVRVPDTETQAPQAATPPVIPVGTRHLRSIELEQTC